jgi:hypothetical protein
LKGFQNLLRVAEPHGALQKGFDSFYSEAVLRLTNRVSINEGFELLFRQILDPPVKKNGFKKRSVRPDLPIAGGGFQIERCRSLVIAVDDDLKALLGLQ